MHMYMYMSLYMYMYLYVWKSITAKDLYRSILHPVCICMVCCCFNLDCGGPLYFKVVAGIHLSLCVCRRWRCGGGLCSGD